MKHNITIKFFLITALVAFLISACGGVQPIESTPEPTEQMVTLEPEPESVVCDESIMNAPSVLDQFRGVHGTLVGFGESWVAFHFDGEDGYRCFMAELYDWNGNADIQIGFVGQTINPEMQVAFSHSGWSNYWSYPIGKTGTLQTTETWHGMDYLFIGDTLYGENDGKVFAYWPEFQKKLKEETSQFFTDIFYVRYAQSWYADEGVPLASGDMCEEMAYWHYLIPVPNDLSFCLLAVWEGDRFGDGAYYGLFDEIAADDYIPTPEEWANAQEFQVEDDDRPGPKYTLVSCERELADWFYRYPVKVTLSNGSTTTVVHMAENGIFQIGRDEDAVQYKLPVGFCR